mmetsp:Transcript_76471/g.119483  ORF Transcript_76471/g.119483 Transcript_76471/m.119483 type:complete len:150 (+) Transcript_76471:358-807(+)
MLDFLSQIILGCLLHLGQNHRGNFLWCHDLVLTLDLYTDHWLTSRVDDSERQKLHILLHRRVSESTSDQTLNIEKSLAWIYCCLILGRFTDQSFIVCESHIRWRDSITLVVRDDFYPAIFENANTRIGCSQINADDRTIYFFVLVLSKC